MRFQVSRRVRSWSGLQTSHFTPQTRPKFVRAKQTQLPPVFVGRASSLAIRRPAPDAGPTKRAFRAKRTQLPADVATHPTRCHAKRTQIFGPAGPAGRGSIVKNEPKAGRWGQTPHQAVDIPLSSCSCPALWVFPNIFGHGWARTPPGTPRGSCVLARRLCGERGRSPYEERPSAAFRYRTCLSKLIRVGRLARVHRGRRASLPR